MTRWIGALLVAGLLATLTVRPAPTGPQPIVLVHGFGSNATTFAELAAWLRERGREVIALDLPGQDNRVNAAYVRREINVIGWNRVDLVMHSMGGLAGRYLVRSLGGTDLVQAYVSLGTPQYGLDPACRFAEEFSGQLCPSGAFLTALNEGDDTPEGPAWATIFSRDDQVVPYLRSRLDGGACHFALSGISHGRLLHSPGVVFPLILAALDDGADATCPPGGAYRP